MMHIFNFLSLYRGPLSWGIVAAFFFYDYLLKFSVSVLKPTLFSEFDISTAEFGWIMSMYMIPYTIAQIPAGIIVDYWGPRRTITLAALTCGLGCLLFSTANDSTGLLLGRALIGFGASFSMVTCSKLAAIWFHPKRFALLLGSMVSIIFIGGISGINLSTFLFNLYGWKSGMNIAAALCLIIAAMMWIVIRDTNPANPKPLASKKLSFSQVCLQFTEVIKSKQAWLAASYAGLMFVPTTILAFWGTAYLTETNELPVELAGGLTSSIFLGWIAGSPVYGFTSGFFGRPKMHMFFAAITTLLFSSLLIFNTGLSSGAIACLLFLVGFCSSGFAIAFTVLKENFRPELVGAAMGFMNTANTLFEVLSVIVVGQVIDFNLGSTLLENYQYAFIFVPISVILALILLPFFNLTHQKIKLS